LMLNGSKKSLNEIKQYLLVAQQVQSLTQCLTCDSARL
jgi:hypothetical protein